MTELAALNVKISGDASGLKAAVSSAQGDLGKLSATANAAGARVAGLGGKFTGAGAAAGNFSNVARGAAQQLSQVGQQTMATGNFIQALAIQLPDLGLAFGAVGAAVGLVAGVALPLLIGALIGTSAQSAEAAAQAERLKAAYEAVGEASTNLQIKIDKLRFGVDEEYQVELLREQIRLRDEYNAKVATLQAYLNSTNDAIEVQNDKTAFWVRQIEVVAGRYNEISRKLSDQQSLATQLAIIEGRKAQAASEAKAATERSAAAADLLRRNMANAYSVYASTRMEANAIADKIVLAGLAASKLSLIKFGNIDAAAAAALTLAGNLGIAYNEAVALSNMWDNLQAGSDERGSQRKTVRGANTRMPKQPWMDTGGAGGGGGGGGANPIVSELETLQQSLVGQEQAQIESFARQQEVLRSALEQRLITQQEYAALMEASQRQHAETMEGIDVWRYGSGLAKAEAFFGGMADALAAGNEKMQKVSQSFAAVEALINAWRAYSQTLADPSLPFATKFLAAAKVLAAGMGAVNAIRNGGRSAAGGGAATAQSAPAQASPLQVSLNTYGFGDMIRTSDLGGLLTQLNNAAGDRGYTILVPRT